MNEWLEYTLDTRKRKFKSRFSYSNYLLKKNPKNVIQNFIFKNLKKNTLYFKQYNYFKKRLNNNTVFLSSGYGYYEYFLKKDYKNFLISDSEKIYDKFNKKHKLSKFEIINILNIKDLKKIKFKPKSIILNSVEYLFDNKQFHKCLYNINCISSSKTNIYVIFRSRYYFFLSFFDKILLPLEAYLKKSIYTILGKKKFVNLNLHGFRRTKNEFENIIKKDFKIIEIYCDLFSVDYERSSIIKKVKIGKILSILFLKSHPYLHIYKLKKK